MLSNTVLSSNKNYEQYKYTNNIIPLASEVKGFRYHPMLDADYLYDFHGNDWEQALFSFELFLDITVKEVNKLVTLLLNQQLEQGLALVHKIRPGFLMVGLTEFDVLFDSIRRKALENEKKEQLSHIIGFWSDNFKEKLAVVELERNRLEFFIKTQQLNDKSKLV